MIHLSDFRVSGWLPSGNSGEWRIDRSQRDEVIYSHLWRGEEMWMDDLPHCLTEEVEFANYANGRILLSGLGLGSLPSVLCTIPQIESIDIIERELDVIELVWSHLSTQSPKIHLIIADALTYKPTADQHWDFAWHDIWLTDPTVEEQQAMIERYAAYADRQFCWRGHGEAAVL